MLNNLTGRVLLMVTLASLLSGCAVNFTSGTALAILQDDYIGKYNATGSIPDEQGIKGLEENMWVATANVLAPSNLVIRQYCLIDVFNNQPKHTGKIERLLNILSYKSKSPDNRLWAEGYSYWQYSLMGLELWVKKFEAEAKEASRIMGLIEAGFMQTAYKRNGVWYPAPFGDLRNVPLGNQFEHPIRTCSIGPLSLISGPDTVSKYYIQAKPIGMNTHIPKDDYGTIIIDGVPDGFHFYEGYDKKYKSKWDEFWDTVDPKRWGF